MPETEPRPVLARMIEAHSGRGPGRPDPKPRLQVALARAIRRAAMPFDGFSPEMGEVTVECDLRLDAVAGHLPDYGLIAAIEDDAGRRGMLTLHHGMLDALIEVQTTGKIEETQQPARAVTRLDEALCRDFLDLMLGAFAKETAEIAGRDWPLRMVYGSKVGDVRQLNLLFSDGPYHVLQATCDLGSGRTGEMGLILPVDPALARQNATSEPAKAATPDKPADWPQQVLRALGAAPLSLDAVLLRMQVPLGRVQALEVGMELPFEREALGSVTLEDVDTRVVAKGHLGQVNGRHAVRLGVGKPMLAGMAAPAAPPAMAAMPEASAPQALGAGGRVNPDAPMPDIPMADPPGAGLPDVPMGGFDSDAPMG